MKKQLLVFLFLAAASPLWARPETITMITSFPNNNLVYSDLHVTERLDALPQVGQKFVLNVAIPSDASSDDEKTALVVSGNTFVAGTMRVEADQFVVAPNAAVGSSYVEVGMDQGGPKDSYAEFGTLKVTEHASGDADLSVGTGELSMGRSQFLLFPAVLSATGDNESHAVLPAVASNKRAVWQKVTAGSDYVFLAHKHPAGQRKFCWKKKNDTSCTLSSGYLPESVAGAGNEILCSTILVHMKAQTEDETRQPGSALPTFLTDEHGQKEKCAPAPGLDNFLGAQAEDGKDAALFFYECTDDAQCQ